MRNLFSSLRARLLASYVLILVITLFVMAGVLMFALRGNPLNLTVNIRLAGLLQQWDSLQEQAKITPGNRLNLVQEAALRRFADKRSIRFLLITSDQKVSFDSASIFKSGDN